MTKTYPTDFYVYLFRDPVTEEVVYVGKGKGKRAWSHLSGSTNPRLENLIKKRQIEGFDMQPEIIASTPSEENSFLIEQALISFFGRADSLQGELFNKTDGGDGVSNPSAEVREAQAEAMYRRFGGKSEHVWVNVDTGEKFEGTRVAFADFLGVDQKRVGKVFQGVVNGILGWRLESFEGDINLYNKTFTFVHHFTGEIFQGRAIDFQDQTGISAAAISMLVKGRIAHSSGWILQGNEGLVGNLRRSEDGTYYTVKDPWQNPNHTNKSALSWAAAGQLYEGWLILRDIDPGIGAKLVLNSCGLSGLLSERTVSGILRKFREGFVPEENHSWREFSASFDLTPVSSAYEKPIGLFDKRRGGWIKTKEELENRNTKVGEPKSGFRLQGKVFDSIKEAAKHYEGRNYNKVLSRLRLGWTPEQAFDLVKRPVTKRHNVRALEIEGREYQSLSEVSATYSVPLKLLHKRLALGWTAEEAVGLTARTRGAANSAKPVVVNGRRFSSIKAACKEYGIAVSTLRRRMNTGISMEEALMIPSKGSRRGP
jgi:hypothetical protein